MQPVENKPRPTVGLLNIDGYFDPLLAFVANMRDRGFTHPRYTDMLVVATEAGRDFLRAHGRVPA